MANKCISGRPASFRPSAFPPLRPAPIRRVIYWPAVALAAAAGALFVVGVTTGIVLRPARAARTAGIALATPPLSDPVLLPPDDRIAPTVDPAPTPDPAPPTPTPVADAARLAPPALTRPRRRRLRALTWSLRRRLRALTRPGSPRRRPRPVRRSTPAWRSPSAPRRRRSRPPRTASWCFCCTSPATSRTTPSPETTPRRSV